MCSPVLPVASLMTISDHAAAVRASIVLEEATILTHTRLPAQQYFLRLHAPQIAARSLPGAFVHLRCAPHLALRRPMSILNADSHAGELDILYRAHGYGTELLAQRSCGERLSVLGPIGRSFKLSGFADRTLLLGGGIGIPPLVFLALHIKRSGQGRPMVLMGSEVPFPFTAQPSRILVPGLPPEVIATMPLLEDHGVAARLASQQGFAGCFDGLVTELAEAWLAEQGGMNGATIEVFACGPTPMLRTVAALCARHQLSGELSLEEHMACAVGGCAGCTVRVQTPRGPAMQRVCVDGPVFAADKVMFEN